MLACSLVTRTCFLKWDLTLAHWTQVSDRCPLGYYLDIKNCHLKHYLSHLMTKPTKWHLRPAKTPISLGIRPVWSESSQCTQWVAEGQKFLHAEREDSDQTGRMPRLIRVFAGRTGRFVMRLLVYFTLISQKAHRTYKLLLEGMNVGILWSYVVEETGV